MNALDAEGNVLSSAIIHATFPNNTSKQLASATYRVVNGTYSFAVMWQNSWVYGITSIPLDVTISVLNLACNVYLVSFADSFLDIYGDPLRPLPSSFKLLFSNGTVSQPLDPEQSYLIQNGTTTWVSVIWQDREVSPPNATFDAKDGNPTVYCLADPAIPEFPFLPFLSLFILPFILKLILRKRARQLTKNLVT